jgi:hypothetical protein
MSLMPDIDRLLETDERNVREMHRFFAGFQGLSELLNEASVLYATCSRAFGQALNHKLNSFPRDIRPDDSIVRALLADRYRALLFARIGVFYSAAVADLLRMRLTVPLGYLRLQCESIALLKLMSENPSVTQQWASIQSDAEGTAFYRKHQPRVREILKAYDLSDAYDHTSGAALHSRFIGLAQGYRSRSYADGLRVIQEDRINLQEFDPENPHRFMGEVIMIVLRTQGLIFANLRDAVPEINDPLLLETRFPQFIERVNQLMNRAREHFAQYFPNDAEQ